MESYKLTADEIVAKDPDLAIIPVGSLEQHGPHLPIMTDWAIATELGRRVAEKMDAFLLPALPISAKASNTPHTDPSRPSIGSSATTVAITPRLRRVH